MTERKGVYWKEKLISCASLVAVLATIFWIIKGINFFPKPTQDEINQRRQDFINTYHQKPPEAKRADPLEISKFYAKKVDLLWKKVINEKGDTFSLEDYSKCLLETISLLKKHVMPFNSNFSLFLNESQGKATKNRKFDSAEEKLIDNLEKKANLFLYTNWYEDAVSIKERKLNIPLLLLWVLLS